jgi:hypothetical protein
VPMQTTLKFSKVILDNEETTACGFATSGGFWCWGTGYPNLGVGTFTDVVGHLPLRVPAFDGLRDVRAVAQHLVALHGNSSITKTSLDVFDFGYLVFRASNFGGNQMRSFIDGPFTDVVCGNVEVLGGTLCRSVWEEIRLFSRFPEDPAVGAFGIPPQ